MKENELRHIIREEIKAIYESRFDKKDIEIASKAADILNNKRIQGAKRKEALRDLVRTADKYSGRPIRTVKQALLTLDLIEPSVG